MHAERRGDSPVRGNVTAGDKRVRRRSKGRSLQKRMKHNWRDYALFRQSKTASNRLRSCCYSNFPASLNGK